MTRANKITVKSIGDGIFMADFYRTHTHVCTVHSTSTEWVYDENSTMTANREFFRKYMADHASEWGVEYDPIDRRTPRNTTLNTYSDHISISTDVERMLANDISRWADESKYAEHLKYEMDGLNLPAVSVELDAITPMVTTAKGYDLSKMGVIDGKYEKTGNWAWADLDVTVTLFTTNDQPIYMTMKMQLVSGQLKKPESVGSGKYTKAGISSELLTSLQELGIVEIPKDTKEDKSHKADTPELPKQEEVEKPKSRRGRKPKQEKAAE